MSGRMVSIAELIYSISPGTYLCQMKYKVSDIRVCFYSTVKLGLLNFFCSKIIRNKSKINISFCE